jgi:hypothetical protein
MTLAEPNLLLKQFGLHISYGVDRLFDGDPPVLVETQEDMGRCLIATMQ